MNVGLQMDVEISEIDLAPVQIQGPKSTALLLDLVGPEIDEIPSRLESCWVAFEVVREMLHILSSARYLLRQVRLRASTSGVLRHLRECEWCFRQFR